MLLVPHAAAFEPRHLAFLEGLLRDAHTWALVDEIAPRLVGPLLERHPREVGRSAVGPACLRCRPNAAPAHRHADRVRSPPERTPPPDPPGLAHPRPNGPVHRIPRGLQARRGDSTALRSGVEWSPTAGRHRLRAGHAHGTTRHHVRRVKTPRPAPAREYARSGSAPRRSVERPPRRRRGHPPRRDAWPDDAASPARRVDRPRPRPGRACGPTPAGSEGAAARSIPTGGWAPRETRNRPGARLDRSCGARRNSDRILAPCTRTAPVDRVGNPGTGTARSPPPDSRTSGSRETPVQRSAAVPDRRAAAPPARGMSRSGRAPVGARHPGRADAVDRWMKHWPHHRPAQGSCPAVSGCGVNELRGTRLRAIAETTTVRAVAQRRICRIALLPHPATVRQP